MKSLPTMMKSLPTMIIDAIITSFCIAGGYCLAALIGTPDILEQIFLLPAVLLVSKLGYFEVSWIKALLFLLLFGALIWISSRILAESRFKEFDILLTLLITVAFGPLLSRAYDAIATGISQGHNKPE